MTYAHLTDEELARLAYVRLDDLTSTDLERELLKRFEALLDVQEAANPMADLLDEYETTTEQVRDVIEANAASIPSLAAMLRALSNEDITDPEQLEEVLKLYRVLDNGDVRAMNHDELYAPEQLKAALTCAWKFRALADDAGEIFTRLNELAAKTQE